MIASFGLHHPSGGLRYNSVVPDSDAQRPCGAGHRKEGPRVLSRRRTQSCIYYICNSQSIGTGQSRRAGMPPKQHETLQKLMEFTILMPCLDEALTVETCIQKARTYLNTRGIDGEILVADNGSTDGSQDLAEAAGARVVRIEGKGYGAALIGGIHAAKG